MRTLVLRLVALVLVASTAAACGTDGTDEAAGSDPTGSPAPSSSAPSAGATGATPGSVAASASSSGSAGSATTMQRITIDGSPALRWGDGAYGVVLAHGASYDAISWRRQARAIAAAGNTVVAVEDISPDAIAAAVRFLQDDGHPRVALVGASAGADATLALARAQPDLPDQLILLSPTVPVDGLGSEPKLFIASRDERVGGVSPELARTAPGSQNRAIVLPGKAHAQAIFRGPRGAEVLQTIIDRLARFGS
ncbi:hypothetical protein [Nocardioides sp.]|uniref:alpha/beta hydrolase n=1 Tax=Nocardioides sp. TaxID=35761 RepID=UPI003515FEC3